MPSWSQLSKTLQEKGTTLDVLRREYLKKLFKKTKRNVIAYYSAWMQKSEHSHFAIIDDSDKNSLMATIHGMDRTKGLDLVLHTPSGDIAATESIVDYLHAMFRGSDKTDDFRVILPQLAMSAGTMIAYSANRIMMGKHSSLGPIDPHLEGLPADGVIREFERIRKEILEDERNILLWRPFLERYPPTFIGQCEQAKTWSEEIVTKWLFDRMFKNDMNCESTVRYIVEFLSDSTGTKTHNRHFSAKTCKEIGLNVEMIEEGNELQDLILSLHHLCMHTLSSTNTLKLIENHLGVSQISSISV